MLHSPWPAGGRAGRQAGRQAGCASRWRLLWHAPALLCPRHGMLRCPPCSRAAAHHCTGWRRRLPCTGRSSPQHSHPAAGPHARLTKQPVVEGAVAKKRRGEPLPIPLPTTTPPPPPHTARHTRRACTARQPWGTPPHRGAHQDAGALEGGVVGVAPALGPPQILRVLVSPPKGQALTLGAFVGLHAGGRDGGTQPTGQHWVKRRRVPARAECGCLRHLWQARPTRSGALNTHAPGSGSPAAGHAVWAGCLHGSMPAGSSGVSLPSGIASTRLQPSMYRQQAGHPSCCCPPARSSLAVAR